MTLQLQVSYLGSNNLFSRVVTTFLRQFPTVKRLNIFGCNDSVVLSEDFRGKCAVQHYADSRELPSALENSDIIVIGDESDSADPSRECIISMASKIFDYAFVTASAAPNAIVVISSNPLNIMFPLTCYVLQEMGCFDRRKLLGVTSEENLRSNPLLAEFLGVEDAVLPVVGGASPQTRVPLFSQARPIVQLKEEAQQKLITDIKSFDLMYPREEVVAERAYATIRTIRSLIQGLEKECDPVTEMAMTKTTLVADTTYFSLPVQLGQSGVQRAFGLPTLEGIEDELLQYAIVNLNHDLTRASDIYKVLKPNLETVNTHENHFSVEKENRTNSPVLIGNMNTSVGSNFEKKNSEETENHQNVNKLYQNYTTKEEVSKEETKLNELAHNTASSCNSGSGINSRPEVPCISKGNSSDDTITDFMSNLSIEQLELRSNMRLDPKPENTEDLCLKDILSENKLLDPNCSHEHGTNKDNREKESSSSSSKEEMKSFRVKKPETNKNTFSGTKQTNNITTMGFNKKVKGKSHKQHKQSEQILVQVKQKCNDIVYSNVIVNEKKHIDSLDEKLSTDLSIKENKERSIKKTFSKITTTTFNGKEENTKDVLSSYNNRKATVINHDQAENSRITPLAKVSGTKNVKAKEQMHEETKYIINELPLTPTVESKGHIEKKIVKPVFEGGLQSLHDKQQETIRTCSHTTQKSDKELMVMKNKCIEPTVSTTMMEQADVIQYDFSLDDTETKDVEKQSGNNLVGGKNVDEEARTNNQQQLDENYTPEKNSVSSEKIPNPILCLTEVDHRHEGSRQSIKNRNYAGNKNKLDGSNNTEVSDHTSSVIQSGFSGDNKTISSKVKTIPRAFSSTRKNKEHNKEDAPIPMVKVLYNFRSETENYGKEKSTQKNLGPFEKNEQQVAGTSKPTKGFNIISETENLAIMSKTKTPKKAKIKQDMKPDQFKLPKSHKNKFLKKNNVNSFTDVNSYYIRKKLDKVNHRESLEDSGKKFKIINKEEKDRKILEKQKENGEKRTDYNDNIINIKKSECKKLHKNIKGNNKDVCTPKAGLYYIHKDELNSPTNLKEKFNKQEFQVNNVNDSIKQVEENGLHTQDNNIGRDSLTEKPEKKSLNLMKKELVTNGNIKNEITKESQPSEPIDYTDNLNELSDLIKDTILEENPLIKEIETTGISSNLKNDKNKSLTENKTSDVNLEKCNQSVVSNVTNKKIETQDIKTIEEEQILLKQKSMLAKYQFYTGKTLPFLHNDTKRERGFKDTFLENRADFTKSKCTRNGQGSTNIKSKTPDVKKSPVPAVIKDNNYEELQPSSENKNHKQGDLAKENNLFWSKTSKKNVAPKPFKMLFNKTKKSKTENNLQKINIKEIVGNKNISVNSNNIDNSFTMKNLAGKNATADSTTKSFSFKIIKNSTPVDFVKRYTVLKKGEVSTMIKEDLNAEACKAKLFGPNNENRAGITGECTTKTTVQYPREEKSDKVQLKSPSMVIFDRISKQTPSPEDAKKKFIRSSHNFSSTPSEEKNLISIDNTNVYSQKGKIQLQLIDMKSKSEKKKMTNLCNEQNTKSKSSFPKGKNNFPRIRNTSYELSNSTEKQDRGSKNVPKEDNASQKKGDAMVQKSSPLLNKTKKNNLIDSKKETPTNIRSELHQKKCGSKKLKGHRNTIIFNKEDNGLNTKYDEGFNIKSAREQQMDTSFKKLNELNDSETISKEKVSEKPEETTQISSNENEVAQICDNFITETVEKYSDNLLNLKNSKDLQKMNLSKDSRKKRKYSEITKYSEVLKKNKRPKNLLEVKDIISNEALIHRLASIVDKTKKRELTKGLQKSSDSNTDFNKIPSYLKWSLNSLKAELQNNKASNAVISSDNKLLILKSKNKNPFSLGKIRMTTELFKEYMKGRIIFEGQNKQTLISDSKGTCEIEFQGKELSPNYDYPMSKEIKKCKQYKKESFLPPKKNSVPFKKEKFDNIQEGWFKKSMITLGAKKTDVSSKHFKTEIPYFKKEVQFSLEKGLSLPRSIISYPNVKIEELRRLHLLKAYKDIHPLISRINFKSVAKLNLLTKQKYNKLKTEPGITKKGNSVTNFCEQSSQSKVHSGQVQKVNLPYQLKSKNGDLPKSKELNPGQISAHLRKLYNIFQSVISNDQNTGKK